MDKTIKGTLLVAGTSIGGGMLALPVLTGQSGFMPSIAIFLLCWLFMASTGLLFLELSLWVKKDANIISMAEATLGKSGKAIAWIAYIFLFYCLTLAYIVGGGSLITEFSKNTLPQWAAPLAFVLIFGPLIYTGAKFVSKLNTLFMAGLFISFFIFVMLGLPHVKIENLTRKDWSLSLLALPITFTSFAYQGIIPTLVHYLQHDIKKIKISILAGSFLPFLIYFLWQWLILGIVPLEGPFGLAAALSNGSNAVQPLQYFIGKSILNSAAQYFAFFALVTSFFGVALGLKDFLADGLKIEKTAKGKTLLCLIIFIPPLMISYTYPHIFLNALNYAGGFGCTILLGLLPVLMVWKGRYTIGLHSRYALPGGKPLLLLLAIFVILVMACQLYCFA